VAVCLLAAGACRKAAEKPAEKLAEAALEREMGGNAKVDIGDGTLTVKTKDGESKMTAGDAASIPENFPKDVLILKDAKVKMSVQVPQGMQVSFESKETPDAIAQTYSREMRAKGWTSETKIDGEGGTVQTFEQEKSGRTAVVMISRSEKITEVVVTATSPTAKE